MFLVHWVNFEEQESELRGGGWEAEDAASIFFFPLGRWASPILA